MAAQRQPSVQGPEGFLMAPHDVAFRQDAASRVQLVYKGQEIEVSSITMAFPLSRKGRMIVVRDMQGEEIGILTELTGLDPVSRRTVLDELERSYFLPCITNVIDITEAHGVLNWQVETDRGPRTFQLRHVRQSLRRLGRRRIVILDVDGNRYDIQDVTALPRRAQPLLDRYI